MNLAKRLSLLIMMGTLALPNHTCGMDPIIASTKSFFNSFSSSCTAYWSTSNISTPVTNMDSRTKKEAVCIGLGVITAAFGYYLLRKTITKLTEDNRMLINQNTNLTRKVSRLKNTRESLEYSLSYLGKERALQHDRDIAYLKGKITRKSRKIKTLKNNKKELNQNNEVLRTDNISLRNHCIKIVREKIFSSNF